MFGTDRWVATCISRFCGGERCKNAAVIDALQAGAQFLRAAARSQTWRLRAASLPPAKVHRICFIASKCRCTSCSELLRATNA